MEIYVVTCTYNVSRMLVDCAFKDVNAAKAYVAELNGDKAKAIDHCQKLLVRRQGESMLKFLDEAAGIMYEVVAAELK